MCATQPIARTVRAAADKEENRGKPRFCFYMPVHEALAGLFGTGCPGYTNCVSVFALTGRLFFPAPADRGARTALACSPLTGGVFFAEIQRWGFAVCGRRDVAAPAAGGKKEGQPAVFLPL